VNSFLHNKSALFFSLAFSPDGQILASGGTDMTINLWNPHTGERLDILEDWDYSIFSIACSPDGKTIAGGNSDGGKIRFWNLDSGELLPSLDGNLEDVSAIAFSPDGQILAGGGRYDGKIKLWNLGTGELLRTLDDYSGWVQCLTFSPDCQLLVSGGWDETIIWNSTTGEQLFTLEQHSGCVMCIAFSSDGKILVVESLDNTIKVWRVMINNPNQPRPYDAVLGNQNPPPVDAVVLGGLKGVKRRLATESVEQRIAALKEALKYGQVNSVAFSSDGQTLASGSHDTTIKLWNPYTGELIRTLTGHSDDVRSVTFSPDAQLLASGSFEALNLWYVDTGELLCTLNETQAVSCVAISPNGQLIGSGSGNGTIEVWSVC
jgi:WD40 repeat protein